MSYLRKWIITEEGTLEMVWELMENESSCADNSQNHSPEREAA